MLISFVLRLSSAALAAGELAGEVEHVASGEREQFRDAAALRAWCVQHTAPVPTPRASAADLHALPSSADPGALP